MRTCHSPDPPKHIYRSPEKWNALMREMCAAHGVDYDEWRARTSSRRSPVEAKPAGRVLDPFWEERGDLQFAYKRRRRKAEWSHDVFALTQTTINGVPFDETNVQDALSLGDA